MKKYPKLPELPDLQIQTVYLDKNFEVTTKSKAKYIETMKDGKRVISTVNNG